MINLKFWPMLWALPAKGKYCYQCGFGYTNCEYMNYSLDWYAWCVKYRLTTSPSPSFKSIQIAKAIKTVFWKVFSTLRWNNCNDVHFSDVTVLDLIKKGLCWKNGRHWRCFSLSFTIFNHSYSKEHHLALAAFWFHLTNQAGVQQRLLLSLI